MHAALSTHMKRATEDAHKPLPASIRWFGKVCVAYGSALVALLVSRATPRKPCSLSDTCIPFDSVPDVTVPVVLAQL